MISEKNGFAISGTVTRSLRVVSVRRLLAAALGEYPSWCTAFSTRRRVASETFSGLLSTRDTVAVETSARAATSWMVVISMSVNNVVPGPGRTRWYGVRNSKNSFDCRGFRPDRGSGLCCLAVDAARTRYYRGSQHE